MSDALFLAPDVDVAIGDTLSVTGDEGRHAAVVKRIKVGESVLVSDGRGGAVRGSVTAVEKAGITLQVLQRLTAPTSRHRWVAVQALAKGDRSEIAIEALTELGIDEIIAWQASRSIVRWDAKVDKGLSRWQSAVREATKQSRRYRVPDVSHAGTTAVCDRSAGAGAGLALIMHEDAAQPLSEVDLPSTGEVLFVIGPEGGISAAELDAFTAAGGQLVSLADGVLRTSTAGVVALAQLQLLAAQQ